MDETLQLINDRLVQICELIECRNDVWIKLQDVCHYEDKTKRIKLHIFFSTLGIRINHKV